MADNLNISPEMIDNLMNMLKSGNLGNSSKANQDVNNVTDYSDANSSSGSKDSFSKDNVNPFSNLDIETIMKIKSIMDAFNNQNDKDSNLLYSLKPYLRKSRQDKLDQYINILKVSQVSKLFKNGNGDVK